MYRKILRLLKKNLQTHVDFVCLPMEWPSTKVMGFFFVLFGYSKMKNIYKVIGGLFSRIRQFRLIPR